MRRAVWMVGGVLIASALWANEQKVIDDALWRLPGAMASIQGVAVVAVVPFEYGPGLEARNVEDKVVKTFSRSGKFKVVDRRALEP